jgi:hypothetical protein
MENSKQITIEDLDSSKSLDLNVKVLFKEEESDNFEKYIKREDWISISECSDI